MDDSTMIIIVLIGAIATVLVVFVICKTIIVLQKGKNERIRNTNETEKAIAETFAKSNKNCNIKTTNLSTKKNYSKDKINYVKKNNKGATLAIFNAISAVLDHLPHS